MIRYVVGPDVAMRLAGLEARLLGDHQLFAPTLFRSQVQSQLYRAVRESETTRQEAQRRLSYIRGLRIRFLGDRVLQNLAWEIAEQLGWEDTLDAEYVALTRLQADALITLNAELADAVDGIVATAPIDVLY